MLSRSSSNATDRIRRAKSTASAHSTTSGHQHLPTITDPLVLRRQAETAAVEAYSRARQQDEASVTSRPSRRRSKNAGRLEGSHFADARRRSIQAEGIKQPVRSVQSSPARSQSVTDEDTIVTRTRSVIPPIVETVDAAQFTIDAPPPLQKRVSGYTDGSPAPRYSQLPEEPSFALHPRTSQVKQADGYGGNLADLSNFSQDQGAQILQHLACVPTATVDSNELELTRPTRVRQRKSFLGSFQKRSSGFDTALPPFNHAESGIAAPHTRLSLATTPSIVVEQYKSRKFSDTLKGRLKKVFRKPSKTSMPIQHVHAKDSYYSVRDHDVSEVSMVDYTDPFMTVAAEEPEPQHQHKFATAQSAGSTAQESVSGSRVTSWTNSTVAMSSIRTSNGPFASSGIPNESGLAPTMARKGDGCFMLDEPLGLERSDSTSTQRKASSFFGRPIRNKLRRTSRPDLRGSGESQGLYSALQRRIRSSRSTETANEVTTPPVIIPANSQMKTSVSDLAMLPSQRQYSTSSAPLASLSSYNKHRAMSLGMKNGRMQPIRSITPELAPVTEAASAEADRTVIHHEYESPAGGSPKSALRRSHAMKAPPPSKEQLLKRKERAESRWTTALTTAGPGTYMNDNPYELPSLLNADRAQSPYNGLPHVSRADVISPSLYSRATDGASPRPDTPDDAGITTITITGREVRKYDISPPKHVHQHQSSRDWRKWLSDEMDSFAEEEHPSRPTSSASMTGRYPVINRSRNSSQQGIGRRPDSGEYRGMHNPSIETALHSQAGLPSSRHRTMPKPKSIAQIEAAGRAKTAPRSDPCPVIAGLGVASPKCSNRPKSAYELRVNYKNNATDRSKPLQVRRKCAEPNMLEDHTILNIYAGPYASGGNHENQRPAELEGSGIPSLPSSEWLGSTKNGARKPSSRVTPTSSSPVRSPGQRMVTSWLDGKSKENVGAFV